MEKLIELLNEYEKNRIEKINSEWKLMVKLSFKPYTEESLTNKAYRSCWEEICSKYYWFIKWLVENEKIDNSKFYDKNILKWFMTLTKEEKADSIIMNLAIQDEPIEFLISILKNV
jgi:hypothetical protein